MHALFERIFFDRSNHLNWLAIILVVMVPMGLLVRAWLFDFLQ